MRKQQQIYRISIRFRKYSSKVGLNIDFDEYFRTVLYEDIQNCAEFIQKLIQKNISSYKTNEDKLIKMINKISQLDLECALLRFENSVSDKVFEISSEKLLTKPNLQETLQKIMELL